MNKRFLTALLTGAFFIASASMFVACKDYDDDINHLQAQIDSNAQAIKDIQTLIQNGSVIKSVDPITNGVKVTLSDGKTFEITNGKDGANGANGADGKDGIVWTIGTDGFWYKDGVKTDYYALGKDGKDGVDGKDGKDGKDGVDGKDGKDGKDGVNADGSSKYYVPNATTKTFWVYNDGDKEPYDSGISFLATPEDGSQGATITAVKTGDYLYLYGVPGGEGPDMLVTISLNGTLKSMVFIPKFYLDGIETIEYPWFGDLSLVQGPALADYKQDGTTNRTKMVHHGKTIANAGYNYFPDVLSNLPQGPIPTRKEVVFGPVIGVDYEINPSNSVLTWDQNLPAYKVLEPEVVYTNTRGNASVLKVTSPKTYGRFTEDAEVFGIHQADATYAANFGLNEKVNYLTAGLKIEEPRALEPYPTNDLINGGYRPAASDLDASYTLPAAWPEWYSWYNKGDNKDNTIALQMQNVENAEITSDYALLIPSRICLEGLIWYRQPMYSEPGFGPTSAVTGDEKGWYSTTDKIFVWDSPEEALDNNNGAALELAVDDDYIDLKKYLGIQILKENVITRKVSTAKWNADKYTANATDLEGVKKFYGDEESFDLHYEFQLVDYEVAGNVTRDSRYATFTDVPVADQAALNQKISYTGRVRALSVNEIGQTINEGSTTAVDREPLVRVMVKTSDGTVMLDGYILIHITNTKANLAVDTYAAQDVKFDFCNSETYKTDWAQFSKHILQDALGNYEKLTFDYFYWADCNVMSGSTDYTADAPYVTVEAEKLRTASVPGYSGHVNTYSMKIFNFGKDIYGTLDATHKDPTDPSMAKGNHNGKLETSNAFEDKALGVVEYYPNADGQNNHRWEWTLSADELEYLTEGKMPNEVVTVTRWIRFQAKTFTEANAAMPTGVTPYTQDNYYAPYPYIWVKMTLNITRAEAKKYAYKEKIDNYWFHFNTGASDGWAGWPIDIQAPGNASIPTIAGQPWNARPSTTLVTNKVNINGTVKYYFAPKDVTVTDPVTGTTYIITPRSSAADNNYDKLICKYIVYNQNFKKVTNGENAASVVAPRIARVLAATDSHVWTEAGLEEQLQKCAVDYNKGVFTNTKLYAVKGGVYTQIAEITQPEQTLSVATTHPGAGEIKLLKNDITKEVLNAVGYPTKADGSCDFANSRSNINKQLRAWLGVVRNNGCDVAEYVSMEKTDEPNVCTFLASWERPINLAPMDPDYLLDANTNENYVFLIDYLKLYDWRGDKTNQGYMYDGHYWFWGYYNIKKITVDVRPENVLTNMHQSNPATFVKLSQVTHAANLWTWSNPAAYTTTLAAQLGQFSFDLITPQYYTEDKEPAIETFMGINPENNYNKAQFGGFYYANNGDNVDEFDIILPITIEYEWGILRQNVKWHINTTHGR